MTREQVVERINQLMQEQVTLRNTLSVYDGAIQDCQHWLKKFDEENTPKEEEEK